MTFKQVDINLKLFKYIVEDAGLRIIRRELFSATELFVPFERIGSEIIKVKERKLVWLISSALFFILALIVFIRRMNGDKVGDGAELFWLAISLGLFIVYAITGKNSLFLVKDDETTGVEFIGTKLYERRVNQFIQQLLHRRNDYLNNKYQLIDGLTMDENILCVSAGIQPEDALFLKRLTKHPVKKLAFEGEETDTENLGGICSITTEKNARSIINKHRDRFISEGKYIFISGFSGNEYKVGLIGKTSDPYKIMEFAKTNGVNHDIETKDIIEKYQQWQEQFGIKPIAIGFDFCECEIVNKDIDYKKLAADIYTFCPDVVDQGTETVEILEKEMKRTGTIFLWWD